MKHTAKDTNNQNNYNKRGLNSRYRTPVKCIYDISKFYTINNRIHNILDRIGGSIYDRYSRLGTFEKHLSI